MDRRSILRIRVPLGFLFSGAFLVFSRPTCASLVAGSLIGFVGLSLRAWAAGHIRKSRELAVSGPYAYTRNPLYLGSFILGVGFTVAAGVWWLVLLFLVLFAGIYWPVMSIEADDIGKLFGEEYGEYAASVPMFIPRATPWKRTGTTWDGELYLQCREYRAALGAVGVIIILAARAYFLP
jgi:protein-S-isoprenylcysteine O-methyltransferase Ste14